MNIYLGTFLEWLVTFTAPIIIGLLIAVLQRLMAQLGIKINESYWNTIHSAMCAGAERLIASQSTDIAMARITVANPLVAKYAQEALNTIPAEAKKVGFTPEAAEQLLLSKLGGLQAKMLAVPVEPKKEGLQ